MIKIGKEYHWEMSHRLPFHKGGCINIHGHSYKMVIELQGTLDSKGMMLDYYEIDKIIQPVLAEYDHALIIDENDENVIEFIGKLGFKHKIINVTSTSENLASHLLDRFHPLFSQYSNLKTITVRVYETSDAYAEVTKTLNN